MCSRLHVQLSTGLAELQLGDTLPFTPAGSSQARDATWGVRYAGNGRPTGFARVETFRQKWLSRGWETGTVHIEDFAEGHEEIHWAKLTGADVGALYRDGVAVLLTRQATPREYHALHHYRVPVQVETGYLVLPQKGGQDWFGV